MKEYKTPVKRKVIPSVTHQGIGGKEILIERELTCKEAGEFMTIGAMNFWDRRGDLCEKEHDNTIIYYGHVRSKDGSWLGYFVAADELESIEEKA